MARKFNVTRTIKTTTVTAMTINIDSASVDNVTLTLSGEHTDEAYLLKAVKKSFDTDNVRVAAILDYHVDSALYGMDEETFIANAVVLSERKETPAE